MLLVWIRCSLSCVDSFQGASPLKMSSLQGDPGRGLVGWAAFSVWDLASRQVERGAQVEP